MLVGHYKVSMRFAALDEGVRPHRKFQLINIEGNTMHRFEIPLLEVLGVYY